MDVKEGMNTLAQSNPNHDLITGPVLTINLIACGTPDTFESLNKR